MVEIVCTDKLMLHFR